MSALNRKFFAASTIMSRISSLVCSSCHPVLTRNIQTQGGGYRRSEMKLTSQRYPKLKRGPFATLTDGDVSCLERLLSGRVITDESELEGYNTDWLRTVKGTLVCEAGCILAKLDDYVSEQGLIMPLDLGAKGSCHIGGNLATNAGGVRLLRYGSLHGSVLGIEAVLPSGEVLDCLSTLRKDNTGYDLKQLLIGSEGTLGIITKATILCPQRPSAVSIAFLGCNSFEGVLNIFKEAKQQLGEILSAFEFMDSASMDVAIGNLHLTNPISDTPFYVLIETGGSNKDHDEEKLSTLLEDLMNKGTATDGTLATETSKILAIWSLRERLAEGLLHDGYCYKYDVSLPLSSFYQLVLDMRQRVLGSARRVVGYGHVGDGNLHLNVTSPQYDQKVMDLIEPYIYDWVAGQKGSVSAEHGLGFKKRDFIYHSKSASAVSLMKQIKGLIDPKGIMNPYKLLPSS
ncbi:D-2-hydroxyglutarate dehydrogenase, mitochondrial-like isoform X2 [Babylonia areolata]|uniref:D-2-hydroxyglutarate dehydrogenase, mitochondrial-like isoform X2 n=1 Tax=Babylonia areolata TaxID=304850 RepID=UPI003FD33C24